MRIAILGSGNIGGTLGKKWAAAGHDVAFGVRDARNPDVTKLLASIPARGRAVSLEAAIGTAEGVLFAVPGTAVASIVETVGPALAGRILVDASNNVGSSVLNNVAELAKCAGAKVFRAFNSIGWENFENPRFGDVDADLFYCGPDGEARAAVESLIQDIGLRPIRVGGIERAAEVDGVAALWFALVFGQKMGRNLAFKVLIR